MVKWGSPRMGNGFVLLTDGASLDIVCHPLFHSRPLGMFMCLLKSLVPPGMPSRGVIMIDGHQGVLFENGQVAPDSVDLKFVFGD